MNAVEIEQAITDLAERPFERAEFAYSFLEAFGNKETTIKRLRAGASNKSDLGGVLQTNNIHILTCAAGGVPSTLRALNDSPATAKAKARFILATDGVDFEAADLESGDTVACDFTSFPDHFGFFLPLAGISTVRQITENAFDIRATSRLNRLYVELLKDNPDWGRGERRHAMNQFMARLIFCFFAEDTSIFAGKGQFTDTVATMSAKDSSNTHEVISTLFRSMNTKREERTVATTPRWAEAFPYVNGGLFGGSVDVPRFSRIARSYLLHVGGLDWTRINPDIFGSMIQAVADDEERGELGMHYTSVPNILKVLNPLFLDDLRAKLADAGANPRTLLHLRRRLARIRVFDPACGSGNFLVIAYKELRALEFEINKRRGEPDRRSDLPITNFRGIELRDFPAEIARLALIIAEYQCDVLYRGPKLALAEFLPLRADNWIVCGNALRLDWLTICPPTGTNVKLRSDDLFGTPNEQAEVAFANEGGEVYICGNPPYAGLSSQTPSQKRDLEHLFGAHSRHWKSFDYVMAWFWKARNFMRGNASQAAFVATNSICQGQLVPMFWPLILNEGVRILFAHTSFKWRNLAAHNAGVTVVIIGLSSSVSSGARIFEESESGTATEKAAERINAYLVPAPDIYVNPVTRAPPDRPNMVWGNKPSDGGNLLLSQSEATELVKKNPQVSQFLRAYYGSVEYIRGVSRVCVWVDDEEMHRASQVPQLEARFERVRDFRLNSKSKETRPAAKTPHRFRQIQGQPGSEAIIVPIHSSEQRPFLPVGLLPPGCVISNAAYGLYGAPLWTLAIIASRLHLIWIATVCGKLKTDYRYSNTLGWNTFPIPTLTDRNKIALVDCAQEILLTREHHFPATIADLYDPKSMPADLRAAHDRNDEVVERIYIGRRFKNDSERLEKLFLLYTQLTASTMPAKRSTRASAEGT